MNLSMSRLLAISLTLVCAIASTAQVRAQSVANADLLPVNRGCRCSIFNQPTLFRWANQPTGEGGPPGLDEPLASDRPDFTEASTTVGRGVLQIETGYTYAYDDDGTDRVRSHSYPETLVRLGVLADWLELRFAYNHATESTSTAGGPFVDVTGAEDIYLGSKIGLTSQHGWLPEMALMPQMTIPTGADEFTADELLPGVNWLYGWDITDRLSTAGSSQINKSVDDDGTDYVEFAQSWTFGFGWTDRLSSYAEFFCFVPSGASTAKPEYYADGGFTFGVTNNLQLDVRGGVGLNDAATDYFVGSGAVVRF
jgi:hypothetical protein